MIKRRIQGSVKRAAGRLAAVLAAVCIAALTGTAAEAQTRLSPDPMMYARTLRLANNEILASVTAFNGGNHVEIYASSNDGASFARVGTINDPDFASGLCCGTIFQLSQAVGSLPAGTLLWAGSVGQNAGTDRRMRIKVYRSGNNGRSWTFSSQIVAPNNGGLWEPEFVLANDGALVMLYSDETARPTYDQRMMKTRTYNGTSWVDTQNLVASTVPADRPGMPVVSRMSNGTRFMTFELCGPAACTTFYKTSADGWNYGSATSMGTAIRLADGRYLAHAPTNTVMPNGAILVVGQMVMNANNTVAAANGTVIFRSASGNPAGPWSTIAAPVPVPNAFNDPCPNYSSPLQPLPNNNVLEIASRLENGLCIMYYNRGSAN